MGLLQEFKQFAMKGNVVDMAVGIIIGAGFGKIVNSLVGDIIMPIVGAVAGKGSFGDQFLYLGTGDKPMSIKAAAEAGQPYIAWGPFIQTTIDFMIVAVAVFMLIKVMNRMQSLTAKETDKPGKPVEPPEEIVLLREIRDSLQRS